jgi:anti-sigma B factor antagonist
MVANPVAPTPELQLNVEKTPSETIFHCSGRITSSTSSKLTHAVRDLIPEKKPIVLDLSKVTFMDSSGLGALVGVWVSAKKGGSELKLISLGQRVKDLLRVTGLEQVLAASRFPDTPSF